MPWPIVTAVASPTAALWSALAASPWPLRAFLALAWLLVAWRLLVALASWRAPRPAPPLQGPLPRVTVVVPCYREAARVRGSVEAVTRLDYPRRLLDVVYVVDNGGDGTLEALRRLEKGHPLRVVRNGGHGSKAGALNHVVRHHARGELVLVVDADARPLPGALRRAVAWMQADPALALVSGRRRIRNGAAGALQRLVAVEFDALYRVEHYGRARLGGVALFHGSNGLFRRSALLEVGGFDPSCLTEDVDVAFRLHLAGHRALYDPDLVEWDEAPPGLAAWWGQRLRWSRGWIQVAARHLPRVHRAPRRRAWLAASLLQVPLPLIATAALLLALPRLVAHGAPPALTALWVGGGLVGLLHVGSGWLHGAPVGGRRGSDAAVILALAPLAAYGLLHALVYWRAALLAAARRRAVWTRTPRAAGRRASGIHG